MVTQQPKLNKLRPRQPKARPLHARGSRILILFDLRQKPGLLPMANQPASTGSSKGRPKA